MGTECFSLVSRDCSNLPALLSVTLTNASFPDPTCGINNMSLQGACPGVSADLRGVSAQEEPGAYKAPLTQLPQLRKERQISHWLPAICQGSP